ncbi:MAG: autotransporter domain-containing protein, partial [Pseudomonadota bacterium]
DGVFTNFEQLAKTGTATLTLSGNQTYATGVEVNAGTLEIANTLSTPLMEIDSGATLLVSGGTFESQILNEGTISGSSSGDTIVFSAGSQIGANAGSAAQVLGGAGNDTIALSDTTEIGANALIDGGADTDLLTYTTAADANFAGANVSGFEQLIKKGAGTLTLSGDHAYTDSTAINAGTLSVTGALTTAQLDVNAGGTLGGIGTITGAVNVASGGRLSPGTSPGTLTIDGDLTLDSGAVSVFEVGGAGSDLVRVSGNANLNGVLELSDGMGGAAVSGFYSLIDVDGTTTGGFTTLNNNGVVGSVFQGTATDPSGGSALNILVQASGQNVQFFDGANLVANGLVDGGSGALNPVSSNFTTLDGLINTPFAGDVAVFTGAPGTVTVDAAQDFEGFQFVTDGYQFTGAELVAVGDSALNTAASFLNADADTNTVIDTVISGSAGIDKFGSGTVQLTRANTFTGATTVVGGQLILSGDGALASETIGVTSGTLSTDGGAFAASASMTIDAPGTLTVSGDETLAALTNYGRTDIGTSATLAAGTIDNLETGTIVLADGASLIGTQNTLNNAGLISVSAGGTLSDTGDINNLSTGHITFSAASGSADFGAQGSSGITNDGQISFLAGNIDLAGDVTNQNSGVIEIASGMVSQTGDFTNSEGARLNLSGGSLTGTSVFNNRGTIDITDGQSLDVGTFNQIDGEVRIYGALLGNLNYTGGDLIGLSSVSGNLVAGNAAILEPGDASLGTLAIGGNLSLEAGSTLLIQVSDAAADQLDVAGSVTIAGGTLQLEDFAAAASDDDLTFIIIDNDGADAVLGGGFDTIVDNLAFLDPVVALNGGDGNDVILSFIMDEQIRFSDLISDTDLGQVAIGLDSAPRDDAEVQALLRAFAPLTVDQVQAGMETLTGEIHAGTQIALASTALYVGDTVTDVLDAHRQAQTGRDNDRFVFAQTFGRDVEIDGSSTGNDMAVRNHGLMFGGGIDVSDNLTLGASLGYIGSKNKVYASAASQSEVRSGALVGFAQYETAAYDVTASLGYMLSKVNTVRAISVGTLFDRAEDHYDGQSGFAKIEAGYRFEAGRVHIRPFASAAVVSTNRLGISERGAGAANLEATASVDDLGEVILGARAQTQITLGDIILVPHAELAYDQLIGDLTPEFMTNFQFGGDAFTITATKPGRHRGRFQTGFSAQLSGSLQGFFDYQNTVSKQDQAHAIKLGIKSKF